MKIFFKVIAAIGSFCLVLLLIAFTSSVLRRIWVGKDSVRKGYVAVVEVTGIIYSASRFLKDMEEITKSEQVKAIVARVNSPGGLVAPSQEIYDALKTADKKVPVVVSMGPLAASGGYYAALGGRKIFASPGTLTASIGVIMEFANTEKLYQWAKIERYTLKSGKFKDVGTPFRQMTPDERVLLTRMLVDIHSQFKATVKERRGLSDAELETYADGRIMTGKQALEARLVDELGGYDDAIRAAKLAAGLPESAYVAYPESRSGFLKRMLLGEEFGEESRFHNLWGGLLGSVLDLAPSRGQGWQILLLPPAY